MGPDKQQIIISLCIFIYEGAVCPDSRLSSVFFSFTTTLKALMLFHCYFMIIKQTLREVASKVFNFFVWFVLFCLCWLKLAELAVNTTGMSLFLC